MNTKNQLMLVHNNLQKLLESKQKALPKNFNQTRFLQNCMAILQDTPEIQEMSPISVARTLLKGAFLGLDFFQKECYAIPYKKNIGTKENPKWIKELQFQTDYKGEIKICKTFSLKPIKEIFAKVVREGDKLEIKIVNGNPEINFHPIPFNNKKIIGAFAVCIYQDGTVIYEEMSAEEIENIRMRFSKNPDGIMWTETPGEAYKKTVTRRLRKWIPIEFSTEQQEAFEEAGDFTFGKVEFEPIEMPKAIEQPEKESELIVGIDVDEVPAPKATNQNIANYEVKGEVSEVPAPKAINKVKKEQEGILFNYLERDQIIANLNAYCKVKGMVLESIARFNFKKSVKDLTTSEEIKKLEEIVKAEGRKIK